MGDDIAAIEEWASIFKDPAALAATITKHMALHRKAIKADIASDKALWQAGQFWQAGITTADLATLAIGPINPVYPSYTNQANQVGLSAMAIPDFVAGLVFGFTGDNELPELEECFHGSVDLVTDAENLLNDLENKNWIKAIDDNAKFSTQLANSVHDCSGAGLNDDFARIAAWADIFTEPAQLVETVTLNWFLHKRGIKKDIEHEKADWAAGNYFSAGVDTADAFVKLIGPVE